MLRVTTAGRAALADADNVGAQAVRITRVLLGSGSGPGGAGDDGRTALRTPRDAAVAGGATQVAARVAVRADILGTAAYNVTEVGLEAVAGSGEPFLFAYWTADGEVYAAAANGVTVLIVAAIDIVSGTPAQLTVAVDPTVALSGASSFAALSDVHGGLVAGRYYRGRADGTRLDAVTRADVLSDLLAGLAARTYPRVVEAAGVRSLEGRTAAQLASEFVLVADLGFGDVSVTPATSDSIVVPAGWSVIAAGTAYHNGRLDLSGPGGAARIGSHLDGNTDGRRTGSFGWYATNVPGGTGMLRASGFATAGSIRLVAAAV